MDTFIPPNPKPPTDSLASPCDYMRETTDRIDLSEVAMEALSANREGKKAHLLVLAGQDVGRTIALDHNSIIIGRDLECGVSMQGEGISRQHARLSLDNKNMYMIEDLSSTNGTFVRGQRITRCALLDGDKVLLGRRTVLKFMIQNEIEENYFQEMYESSTRDALTGVYNRKYLLEKVVVDLSFARRHHIPFTLMMIDIDHFKQINDTYGHQTGDRALQVVASSIDGMIRVEDTFGRYGGEEFAIIAQGTKFEGGKVFGERVRQLVAEQSISVVGHPEQTFTLTISMGVATVQGDVIAHSATIISVADKNLYAAKAAGRNRVVASLVC